MDDALPPRELRLEDLQWLRALALRLVRDPHLAEDAVQDTVVTAMERRSGPSTAPRAWLATVLRNFVRQEWRSGARRSARESEARRPLDAPSTLEVVEELALHRRLVEEVHALDEPYRSTILLRYLRGFECAEIARELGVPEKTVRSRLARGIERLRARMGRDRLAWAALLARRPPPAIPWPSALLLVPMKTLLGVAVLCLSLLGAYLALGDPPVPDRELAARPASAAVDPTSAPGSLDAPRAKRIPADAGPETDATHGPARETSGPGTRVLRGSVRSLAGRGVADVVVAFEPRIGAGFGPAADDGRARSGPGGAFELPLPQVEGRLSVVDERWATVASPHLDDGSPPLTEVVIVVAPSADYAGRVVDPDGLAIPRAGLEIRVDGPSVESRDVGGTVVHLLQPFAADESDEEGAFRFEHVGFVEGAFLSVAAEGFAPGRFELPAASHGALELVLHPGRSAHTIFGLVLDATGAPAFGARVSLGASSVTSGPDGAFVLDCEAWRREGWLRAAARGSLPAELALAEALRPSSSEHPVVLRLGPAPLAIRGRVVDPAGDPVPEAVVFSPDPTPFGLIDYHASGHTIQGLSTLEGFLAGAQSPWELAPHAVSSRDGAFVLEGLLDRSYALFALDPRTLEGIGPIEVQAGDERVELRLQDAPTLRVAGRVVSRSGSPLAGVDVSVGRRFDWDEGARASRWSGFAMPFPSAAWSLAEPRATTDEAGRFALDELVPQGAFLTLRGTALVLGSSFELDGLREPGALELVVDAACRFRIVLASPAEGDAFALETADGGKAVLFLEVEGVEVTAETASLDGGCSGVVLVEEGDYDLVLFSGGSEARRRRVHLPPGGLHEVGF